MIGKRWLDFRPAGPGVRPLTLRLSNLMACAGGIASRRFRENIMRLQRSARMVVCLTAAALLVACGGKMESGDGTAKAGTPSRMTLTPGPPNDVPPGGTCQGTAGQWSGCRGNGCAVCSEQLGSYPCYFQNHPSCARNDTCAGVFFTCNAACPAPTAADAACAPPPPPPPPPPCGDGFCDRGNGESCSTCPADCGSCGGGGGGDCQGPNPDPSCPPQFTQ
jgi:hypothetical protein